jgi:hypothetical protein
MVIVPVRLEGPSAGAGALFAATVNATAPLPEPDAPLVTVIHDALEAAVHAQPPAVVTATDPLPPVASNDWLVGAIE